ncbi:histone H1, gonadal-like [Bacillus rossius redtenbacheri]|uniref:histone H1, gonadal-like n=1 Tax=Bacillus rossius redtenbacheri TaxID=93214 RepID=UPI002FDDAE99
MASRCGRKVLEAVRTLGEPRGCTMAEVVKYVRQHWQSALSAVRSHVLGALERLAARGLVRRVSRRYAAVSGVRRRRRSRSPRRRRRRRLSATKSSSPRGGRTCPKSPRGRPPTRRSESSPRRTAKRNRKPRKRSPTRKETRGRPKKTAEVEEGQQKEERRRRQSEECDCEEANVLEKLLQGTQDSDVRDCPETTQKEDVPPEKQKFPDRTPQETRDALTLATTCPRCCCKLIVRVKKTAT